MGECRHGDEQADDHGDEEQEPITNGLVDVTMGYGLGHLLSRTASLPTAGPTSPERQPGFAKIHR